MATQKKLPTARKAAWALWKAVRAAESLLDHHDAAVRLKAVSSMATVGGVYLRAFELVGLEDRLTAVEKSLKTRDEAE